MFTVEVTKNNNSFCIKNLETGECYDLSVLKDVSALNRVINDMELNLIERAKRDEYIVKLIRRRI